MADAVATFAVVLEDHVSADAKKASASITNLNSSLKGAGSELAGFKHQLSSTGGGEMASHLGKGAMAAEGFAAALGPIAVAAGVAVSALGGLVSVIKFGVITALEEANEKAKFLAGFEALGGKGAGESTMAMLDELGAKLPQSEAQLVSWTKHLQAMGITDMSKIRSELIATASAQAIMGDSGAEAYQKIQERVRLAVEGHHGLALAEKSLKALYSAGVNQADVAKRMGMSTEDLSAKLKAGTIDAQKFGDALSASVTAKGKGPLDVMMSSIDAISKRAHKVFGDLFEDVDTKPLTDALRNIVALGEAGAPSGDALKSGITTGLNGVIRMLGTAITEGEIFFLTIEVKALQAYIALKPLINAVGKISDAMGGISGVVNAVGGAPTKTAGALGSAFGADAAESQKAGDLAGGLLKDALIGTVSPIPSLFLDVLTSLGDAKAQEIAREQGVQVGKATIEGIREGTETHSPSLAAMKIGMGIGEGLGMGMEDSPAPARAARTISGNALGGLAGGGVFGGAPANDTGGVTIGQITVEITAPNGVTGAQELSVIGLATALERFQIGSGR